MSASDDMSMAMAMAERLVDEYGTDLNEYAAEADAMLGEDPSSLHQFILLAMWSGVFLARSIEGGAA